MGVDVNVGGILSAKASFGGRTGHSEVSPSARCIRRPGLAGIIRREIDVLAAVNGSPIRAEGSNHSLGPGRTRLRVALLHRCSLLLMLLRVRILGRSAIHPTGRVVSRRNRAAIAGLPGSLLHRPLSPTAK